MFSVAEANADQVQYQNAVEMLTTIDAMFKTELFPKMRDNLRESF